jgi:uncharacterized membrane protein HdeD (DUF308 family)
METSVTSATINDRPVQSTSQWLKAYYFTRFAFSTAWVLVTLSIAKSTPLLAAIMLVGYPAWDAIANFVDAQRSGGITRNVSQLLNFIVSIITVIAVAIALSDSMASVLLVFGIWAVFAGIFQLATAVGRWKSCGAQWAMILSGAQSALAGIFMVKIAYGPTLVGIADIAPYVAFGAFYFLVSAIWLTVSEARASRAAH